MRRPLVFSLPVEEKWTELRDRGLTADWEVLGASAWNHGLLDPAQIAVEEQPVGAVPFGKAVPAVFLRTPGAPLAGWTSQDGVAGDPPVQTSLPATGQADAKMLQLVPYASTKLRMTAFPVLSSHA